MNDPTEGVATTTTVAAPTIADQSAEHYEKAFASALERATGTEPEKASAAKPGGVPSMKEKESESEFPEEILSGEKPAAKEPEKDDLDEIQVSPKMGEAQKGNFAKLKELTRAARQEAAAFKKQLEELRSKSAEAPEVDGDALTAAQERIAEMEALVERTHFESSPRYRALVEAGQQAIKDAKSYLEGTEIDPSVIDYAAIAKGKARVALLKDAGLDAETIAALSPSLAHADRLERERAAALENARGLQSEWQAQEKARNDAQTKAERAEEDRIFLAAGHEVSKAFEPFQKIDGQDKWNAQVDALSAQAKEFFNGSMSLEDMAEIAYYGVGAKVMHKMFHATRAENKALKEQLSKLKAAQPAGGGSTNGSTATPTHNGPMTEDQLFAARAAAFDRAMGR